MIHRVVVAAAVSTALVCTLPAQGIRITNTSNYPRTQWVDVALPASDAAALPLLCRVDPHGWPAVRGATVGMHSVLYHVLANLPARATHTGTFVPVSADPQQLSGYGFTDWVADDTPGLLPIPVVVDNGNVEHRLQQTTLDEVESTPARKVWRLRGRVGSTPLVYEAFVYVYTHQDVVEFEASWTNSDPRTGAMHYDFDLMWLEVGEPPVVDFRTRLGLPAPLLQTSMPTHPSFGKWVQVLSGPRLLGRGEQFHVTGTLLCLPDSQRPTPLIGYDAGPMHVRMSPADRIGTLMAQFEGPAVAVCTDWQGKWLGFGLTPAVPNGAAQGGWSDANQSAAAFSTLLRTPGTYEMQRPRGLNRNASTTGAQEDFGACKGAFAVTVGDPRYIHELAYSVHGEMAMRGYHYREVDATPVRKRNHPGLQTFNQLINCRTTTEFLGIPCPLPYTLPSIGYTVFDDQHRSQNNFNALLALTGDWSLRSMLQDLNEIDQTQVPGYTDTPRAEGRLFMAWASMLLLLDDPQQRADLLAQMGRRIDAMRNNWPGRQFVNNPNKPIRALSVGSDPTFLEPNNTRTPAIIVWEHSIAVMGYYAGYRVTGDQRLHDMAAEISRLIVERCIFQQGGTWYTPTCVRYLQGAQEGNALPASSYYVGSPDVLVGSYSFYTWILPAVLVCRELHSTDAALVARCNAILQGFAPNGPTNWDESQWWAVLPY